MPHPRVPATVALLIAASAALVGCTSEAPLDNVATLNTTEPSSHATGGPTGAPEDGKPRERLDMTAADLKFLYAKYDECMSQHGVTGLGKNEHGNIGPGAAVPVDAATACAPLKPLPAWEKDRTNPHALDFAEKVIDCLRGKGVKYVELYDSPSNPVVGEVFGGPNHDPQSNELGQKYQAACELQVYRTKK
jgi:hypothetical protein